MQVKSIPTQLCLVVLGRKRKKKKVYFCGMKEMKNETDQEGRR